MSIKDSKN